MCWTVIRTGKSAFVLAYLSVFGERRRKNGRKEEDEEEKEEEEGEEEEEEINARMCY